MGFTRNYKNLLMKRMGNPYQRLSSEYAAIPLVFDDSTFLTIKSTNGTIYRYPFSYCSGINTNNESLEMSDQGNMTIGMLYSKPSWASMPAKILLFGTNDAEETVDDYTLSEISTLTYVQPPKISSSSYDGATGKLIISYNVVIQNTADITINELGIGTNSRYQTSYSSNSGDSVKLLLYRKKLDTPIELTANEPQLVTFSIEFDYPA